MQYTTNYNLSKPEAADVVNPTSRTAFNTNADTLDTTIKTIEDDISNIEDNIGDLDDLETSVTTDLVSAINSSIYTLPTASSTVKGGVKIGWGLNINNGIISNPSFSSEYISGTGGSGNIWWRKWNSGYAEIWGYANVTPTSMTAQGGIYYSDVQQITLPFTMTKCYSIQFTSMGAGIYCASDGYVSDRSTIGVRICGGNNSTTARNVFFRVDGTYQ